MTRSQVADGRLSSCLDDLRPYVCEAAAEEAVREWEAAFLVLDGHRDPADDSVTAAEARLLLGEADEERLSAGVGRAPEAKGHVR